MYGDMKGALGWPVLVARRVLASPKSFVVAQAALLVVFVTTTHLSTATGVAGGEVIAGGGAVAVFTSPSMFR